MVTHELNPERHGTPLRLCVSGAHCVLELGHKLQHKWVLGAEESSSLQIILVHMVVMSGRVTGDPERFQEKTLLEKRPTAGAQRKGLGKSEFHNGWVTQSMFV